MRKVFTLLGFLAIVAVAALCAFSVSATEKPDTPEWGQVIAFDSRGTDFVLVDIEAERAENREHVLRTENNNLAVIPFVGIWEMRWGFNDPYLRRSQAWIKWNNINASGKSTTVKHVRNLEPIRFQMLC